MNDIAIAKIIEPDQTVIVLAGEGYIAVEVYYGDIGSEESTVPDAVIFFGLEGAERMRYAFGSAIVMESQILGAAGSMADGQ